MEKTIKSFKCHGGQLGYYTHTSPTNQCTMHFSLFMPAESQHKKVPLLIFLSGLTCTEDNFTTKAAAYKTAARLGLGILVPDTSPRGHTVPDSVDYDLGQGASFYIDATQAPWTRNYNMETYLIKELLPMIAEDFAIDPQLQSIFGHSMGGHGALTLYFKYPDLFRSCSAFAPIVAPATMPWGQKAFASYLGKDVSQWHRHDACALVRAAQNPEKNPPILIDQGTSDQFLQDELQPQLFETACAESGQKLQLRMQEGYDHSYFFIQSFIDDHIEFHGKYLVTGA